MDYIIVFEHLNENGNWECNSYHGNKHDNLGNVHSNKMSSLQRHVLDIRVRATCRLLQPTPPRTAGSVDSSARNRPLLPLVGARQNLGRVGVHPAVSTM